MSVKGGSSHISPVNDVLHGNIIVALFLHQRHQGIVYRTLRALAAPVSLEMGHRGAPFLHSFMVLFVNGLLALFVG